ncbi:MAG: GWxTD domain-containing protein [Ignavibacteria bacterium]
MKSIKLIVLVFLVFVGSIFSQKMGRFSTDEKDYGLNRFDERFFYSIWLNPVQYDENLIFSYHIRYDLLLFEKTPYDTFKAKVKVILELSSFDALSPIRNVDEVIIKSTDFNQTISKEIYYTSNFSLEVPNKRFKATLSLFDEIRNKEIAVKNFEIDLDNPAAFEPIFIKESDLNLINSESLKNRFYNFIPFGTERYLLVLPDRDEFSNIFIKDDFFNYKLTEKFNTGFRYSIYSIDTLDLIEGEYQLIYSDSAKTKVFFVRWLNKPDYLKNPEKAIKVLKYLFEKEENLDKTFNNPKERQRKFYSLWKKLDPTPSTPFNELMAEFYKRADYASNEFRSVSQPDGVLTDRGKIYLIYGPPDSVERSFSQDGRAIEVWTYNSTRGLKFIFFDENKNGNYILQQ